MRKITGNFNGEEIWQEETPAEKFVNEIDKLSGGRNTKAAKLLAGVIEANAKRIAEEHGWMIKGLI